MSNDTLIFIPTYNEKENVQKMFQELSSLDIKADILFVDDNSPDGTGEVLDKIAEEVPNVHVVHRTGKLGIGTAHKDGIKWAYEHKYKTLITMDSDFTHPPESVPELLKNSDGYDVVVGSRYLHKDSLAGWNLHRKFLTHLGHFLTRFLLKIKYDATGAFRLYKLDRVPASVFTLVSSNGYSFFYESLYILCMNDFKINEIPIQLPPRTYGHSKMNLKEIWHSFIFLFSIYFNTILNREKFEVPDFEMTTNKDIDPQGWNDYWQTSKSTGGILYDVIAAFYRKFIIKRNLNKFIKKYFDPDINVLHAGCGSGQVDTDITDYISITALDISSNSLNFYRKVNGRKCDIIQGDIFNIPVCDEAYDGVYNLGVLEHFSEEEIHKIILELHRVLKLGGRAVIFWVPEFGLSVTFFKCAKFILEKFLGRKNVKFHPDEPTRVKSKSYAIDMFNKSNFNVIKYSFGIGDLFTYSIIVAEKK